MRYITMECLLIVTGHNGNKVTANPNKFESYVMVKNYS